MKRTILTGLILPFLTACGGEINENDLDKIAIPLTDVQRLVQKDPAGVALLDARSRSDFEARHIPGATNIPLTAVSGVKGETDPRFAKAKTIIVYGDDPGSASARALAKKMLASGYTNVRFFQDGLLAWEAAKLPVQSK